MLTLARGLVATFAKRAPLGVALRYKVAQAKSTGVSPLVRSTESLHWTYPDAATAGRAPPRVIPPRTPEFLRAKLDPPEAPRSRAAPIPPNIRRKDREKTLLRPLEDLELGTRPRAFRIERSRMGNFPIYTDIRNGGSKIVTILRKYSGDVLALAEELQAVTGKEVTAYHGRLEVRGRHAPVIAEWLGKLGF